MAGSVDVRHIDDFSEVEITFKVGQAAARSILHGNVWEEEHDWKRERRMRVRVSSYMFLS